MANAKYIFGTRRKEQVFFGKQRKEKIEQRKLPDRFIFPKNGKNTFPVFLVPFSFLQHKAKPMRPALLSFSLHYQQYGVAR